MDLVEAEGDSIDAAIDKALKLLGAPRDRVTIEILSEGRKGILGFGAQKAKVRAALRKSSVEQDERVGSVAPAAPAPPPGEVDRATMPMDLSELSAKARSALDEILRHMGVAATVEVKTAPNGVEIILDVKTTDSGLLIGRKGQTLEALQYLVGRIAGERQGSDGPHIAIDVENYRERRRKTLEDMALRLGEKAKRQRKTVTVDALSPMDRRIIHEVLQDDPWLTTKSLGQGSYRRLLIIPEGDRKIQEEIKPGAQEPAPARPARRGRRWRGAPKPAKNEG
jgi:spoIIIJ-associated protein